MSDKSPFYFTDTRIRKNYNDVINQIIISSSPTRANIARKLGLSRTTLSKIVDDLTGIGLIIENGQYSNGTGRPATCLSIVENSWHTIGAEYHSGRWIFIVIDLKSNIKNTLVMELNEITSDCFIETFMRGLRSILSTATTKILPAIGIGVPGQVDIQKGIIIQAADLGWVNINLKSRINKEIGFQTFIVNRNHACGFAESRYGNKAGSRNMIYVGIGTGISSAIIINNTLLKGTEFSAGEIGHIVIDEEGPQCNCGKKGCLQTLASEEAIIRYANSYIDEARESGDVENISPLANWVIQGGQLTGLKICNFANAGDILATKALKKAGIYLAKVLSSMINILNPEKIIIGGPIGNVGEPLLGIIKNECYRWALETSLHNVIFETGILGEFSGALGAGGLVLERKLELIYSSI